MATATKPRDRPSHVRRKVLGRHALDGVHQPEAPLPRKAAVPRGHQEASAVALRAALDATRTSGRKLARTCGVNECTVRTWLDADVAACVDKYLPALPPAVYRAYLRALVDLARQRDQRPLGVLLGNVVVTGGAVRGNAALVTACIRGDVTAEQARSALPDVEREVVALRDLADGLRDVVEAAR